LSCLADFELAQAIKSERPSRKMRHSLINHWQAAASAILIILGTGALAAVDATHPPPLSASARQNERKQIRALMADKAKWTKTQQKLDSQLIFAARFKATGIVHPAAQKLRPDVTAEADGRYKVEIKATVTPGLLAAIQAADGTIISSMPDYHVIQAALPVENIEAIAARDEVRFIRPPPKARHNDIDSQGDTTHEAITARADFGVNGAGVKVGVLSNSIDDGTNALNNAVSSGNINPTNTFVLPGQAGVGNAEGLAMCEIVHDLAPDARVGFATGASSEAQMASNIIALAENGCNIICDDVSYPDESPFQDGPIAQAVQTVAAMGVLYVSCSRNSGNYDDGTSSTCQSDFTNGGSINIGDGEEGQMQFGPNLEDAIGDYGSAFEADLFWSDPLGASTNDYDLYMVDGVGDIVYSSENVQNGTQDPYESIPDKGGYSYGYYLVVLLNRGVSRYMYLDFGKGALDWFSNGCAKGHNACDATNSLTVAATPAYTAYVGAGANPTGPYPEPFNSDGVVELFSADGPRRMFYYSDGTPITPGDYSQTGGTIIFKPDLTAADGVSTTVPGVGGNHPFFGTSAATPHAAAIAALVWSKNPDLTAAQVCNILTNSCIDIMRTGWDRDSGYGILMANLALSNTPAPTATTRQLAFTTQPGGGIAGTAWAIQPVVTFQDGSGNTLAGTGQNVTLSIQNNSGPGGTLNGNVTMATVAGVATFTGLSIDTVGTGYTLTATGNSVDTTPGTVVSSGFNITAAVQSAPNPSIVLSGGAILMTWPTSATGFNLQSSPVLGPSAVWTIVTGQIAIGGQNIVTIIPSGTSQFFRLSN
jgi:hypothetical protein